MHTTSEQNAERQTLGEVSRTATLMLQDPTLRRSWLESAKRARRWLLVVVGLGLFVVPWLSEAISDGIFEPKRSRRLFGRDRVQRDPAAETLDTGMQLLFWVGGLAFVAREAWRERPGEGSESLPPADASAAGAPPPADPGRGSAVRRSTQPTAADSGFTPAERATALATASAGGLGSGARYRIDAELGRGGMGVVYRATDTVLDRVVALKSLPAELLTNQELVKRFQREAKTLACLTHPNIVSVYDLVPQDGQMFMAMELVRGRDLAAFVEERGRLEEREAVGLALQTARALAHAHEQGIIHRDFKPDNVLITADGTAKVTDFGLAKSQSGPRMTQTGAVMGTPYYMSPEQSSGDEVDARTDLYALGATLYELLSGEPPFTGNTAQILIAHISQPPPPLRERVPHVSEALAALVHALLEKKREDRPQSMAEVVQRLERLEPAPAASA